jgi:hypothetical protein
MRGGREHAANADEQQRLFRRKLPHIFGKVLEQRSHVVCGGGGGFACS